MSSILLITSDVATRASFENRLGDTHRLLVGRDLETAMTVLEVWPVDILLFDERMSEQVYEAIFDYCQVRFRELAIIHLSQFDGDGVSYRGRRPATACLLMPVTDKELNLAMQQATTLQPSLVLSGTP